MVFTIELLWLFIAAMVISSIGFKNYVWFISLGYGFSIVGEGVLMLLLYGRQWSIVAIGYIGIIFVMFSGARRLEIRQNKNYGNDPEYQKYVKTVPIMVPFIPLYSVEKYKWLVA